MFIYGLRFTNYRLRITVYELWFTDYVNFYTKALFLMANIQTNNKFPDNFY